MTPAEATGAAELARAEVRYRHQLAREMAAVASERGQAGGYLRGVADVKAVQHGLVLDAELEGLRRGTWRPRALRRPAPGGLPGPGTTPTRM